MAATRTGPVTTACHASPSTNGPRRIARIAPATKKTTFRPRMIFSAGRFTRKSAELMRRVRITTKQNTGSARSFATAPDVPNTNEAPRVTKFPVTWAVNSPCSARKPAVSTKPALRLNSSGSVGLEFAAGMIEPSRERLLQGVLQFDPDVVAVVTARLTDRVSDLVVHRFQRAGQIGVEPIVDAQLPVGARPGTALAGRTGDRDVGLHVDRIRSGLAPLEA